MTDFFKDIYDNKAAQYEEMVSFEDYRKNLPAALEEIRPFKDLRVVELGAGTGRLTAMLAPSVKHIQAFDISPHMLAVTTKKMKASGLANWETKIADNRNLPVADGSADVAIEGWSLGHSVGWYPDNWRGEIDTALEEMKRVLKPDGTLIILETLGTGFETPTPPTEGLASFYQWLETEKDFTRKWIRTDYKFNSPEHAAKCTRFFFGDELADRILADQMTILPECTGVWWRTR